MRLKWLFDAFRKRKGLRIAVAGTRAASGEGRHPSVSLMRSSTEDEASWEVPPRVDEGDEDNAATDERESDEREKESGGEETGSGGWGETQGQAGDAGKSTAGGHPEPGRSGPAGSGPAGSGSAGAGSKSLPAELHYLDELIRHRIGAVLYPATAIPRPKLPLYDQWELPIGTHIVDYNKTNTPLTGNERRLLLIPVVDHVQPALFDHSINSVLKGEVEFPKIGFPRGKNFRGFIPSGQTAIFLL